MAKSMKYTLLMKYTVLEYAFANNYQYIELFGKILYTL